MALAGCVMSEDRLRQPVYEALLPVEVTLLFSESASEGSVSIPVSVSNPLYYFGFQSFVACSLYCLDVKSTVFFVRTI